MTAIPAADDHTTTAPCRTNPDLWHSDRRADRAAAQRICQDDCPFTSICYEIATRTPLCSGMWGGVSWNEGRPAVTDWRDCRNGHRDGWRDRADGGSYCADCKAEAKRNAEERYRQRRATACQRGHDLTQPGAVIGYRCRQCKRDLDRERKAAKKAAA